MSSSRTHYRDPDALERQLAANRFNVGVNNRQVRRDYERIMEHRTRAQEELKVGGADRRVRRAVGALRILVARRNQMEQRHGISTYSRPHFRYALGHRSHRLRKLYRRAGLRLA